MRDSLSTLWLLVAAGVVHTGIVHADIDNDIVSLTAPQPYTSHTSNVTMRVEGDTVAYEVLTEGNSVYVGLDLTDPAQQVDLTGYGYFYFEARGSEPITVARIIMTDAEGDTRTHEPDTGILMTRTRTTCQVSIMEGAGEFGPVRRVVFLLWMPHATGQAYTFTLLRAEFRSLPYSQEPDPAGAFTATPEHLEIPVEHRRWVQISPGGGGWFRSVEFSPHEEKLIIGGDVSGVYVSTDGHERFATRNHSLINRYVQSVVYHPTDPDIIFLGTWGGVARSLDGGQSWEMRRQGFRPLRTFGHSASVLAIAIDPVETSRIYAGLGNERRPSLPSVLGYVYKSIDVGDTWREIEVAGGAILDETIVSILIDPTNTSNLYLLSESKLFLSQDRGETWGQLDSLPIADKVYTSMAMQRDQPGLLLISYWNHLDTSGVFKSLNGGLDWQATSLEVSVPYADNGFRTLKDHPLETSTFYASYHGWMGGVYATTDAGETWTLLNDSVTEDRAHWHGYSTAATDFAIDPKNPDVMCYINDMEVYLSTDGGTSWRDIASTAVTEATPEEPPTYRGTGLAILCAQDMEIDPRDPREAYLAYWDTTLWKTVDGGDTLFRLAAGGLGSHWGQVSTIRIDPRYPDMVFAARGTNAAQSLFRSVDSGRSFELVGVEETGLPSTGYISAIEIDPRSDLASRTLYVGVGIGIGAAIAATGVYKSTDVGLTWFQKSTGLPENNRNITGIAINPVDSSVVYACTKRQATESGGIVAGYVARSTDSGESWQVVLTGIDARSIALDPFDPSIVYVGNRDYSGHALDRIFYKSVDAGQTWTYRSGTEHFTYPFLVENEGNQGLRFYLATLATDPARPGRIYAGFIGEGYEFSFGGGIFVSDDRGESWSLFDMTGIQSYSISKLLVDRVNTSRIYALTGGNGVWRYGAPPIAPVIPDRDGGSPGADLLSADRGGLDGGVNDGNSEQDAPAGDRGQQDQGQVRDGWQDDPATDRGGQDLRELDRMRQDHGQEMDRTSQDHGQAMSDTGKLESGGTSSAAVIPGGCACSSRTQAHALLLLLLGLPGYRRLRGTR